jgi:hypothetical protein
MDAREKERKKDRCKGVGWLVVVNRYYGVGVVGEKV